MGDSLLQGWRRYGRLRPFPARGDAQTGLLRLGTRPGRDQLKSVTFDIDSTNAVSYTYDLNGNVLTRTPGTNPASSFVYDAVNQLTKITHNFNGGVSKTLNYGYDEVGRRTYLERDGIVTNGPDGFEYDNNGQLTKFHLNGTLSGGVVSGGTVTSYTLDASGNRTNAGGETYTPNNLNQYSNVGGLPVSNEANGNLGSYNGWYYTYDSMNRLTAVSGPGAVYANFYYDGLGRQVAYGATSSPHIISVWDGWDLAAAYIATETAPVVRMTNAGHDLIRYLSTSSFYYYRDALGSTTHVADNSGNLLEKYTYDAYGKPTFYDGNGTVLPNGSAYGVELLYTGQDWLSTLGLYDLRNRAYMPSLGRFLQPDPIGFAGDPASFYRYCGNNPVNWSDPSGLLANKPDGGSGDNGDPDPSTWTIGGQPYPDDPSGIPNVPDGGELPRIVGGPAAPEPFSNPGGADSLFGHGGGPKGGGGGGDRQRRFYAPRNYHRFNRALAHVVGPTALVLPAQSLRNAPVLINIFSKTQLGLLNHYVNGYPIQPTDGMHSYYPEPFGTIYVARDITSVDGFNGTYAHELSDMLIGNLTHSELTFGNPAAPDDDVGYAVELAMFGGHIPPDQ